MALFQEEAACYGCTFFALQERHHGTGIEDVDRLSGQTFSPRSLQPCAVRIPRWTRGDHGRFLAAGATGRAAPRERAGGKDVNPEPTQLSLPEDPHCNPPPEEDSVRRPVRGGAQRHGGEVPARGFWEPVLIARPTLFNYRKLLRLARRIVSKVPAIGHLVLVWNSCLRVWTTGARERT
jgi:hypothetical protein